MNTLRAMTRLLDIKRRASEVAEGEHAKAHVALETVEAEATESEQTWQTMAGSKPLVRTVSDLEDHVITLRMLRRIADSAAGRVEGARAAYAAAQAKMAEARREVCRYETWLERQEAARAEEARRQERIREDEHAARKRSVA